MISALKLSMMAVFHGYKNDSSGTDWNISVQFINGDKKMKFRLLYSMIMLLLLASPVFSASTNYFYDELNRLHQVVLENSQTITYEYDQIGNMISRTASGNVADTGSIIQSTPGVYTHTFTSNATVTVNYLNGAGGGGWGYNTMTDESEYGEDGAASFIAVNSIILAQAFGGEGGYDGYDGTAGGATNSIGGSNLTGGGGSGGYGEGGPNSNSNGAAGGKVSNGTFTVLSGQTLTIVVGDGGIGGGNYGALSGSDGSVSLSWR